MPERWMRYDSIAEIYARVISARLLGPAEALAADAAIDKRPLRVLDVGAGTGIATRSLLRALAPGSVVYGIDISRGMLLEARRSGLTGLAVGDAQSLPFANGQFDLTAAKCVLSHVPDHATAIREMSRVLRPSGRVLLTAWSDRRGESEITIQWRTIAATYVPEKQLAEAQEAAVPSEASLANPNSLREALAKGGFGQLGVEVHPAEYRVPTAEHLEELAAYSIGRFMRATLPGGRWQQFRREVDDALLKSFPPTMTINNEFLLAIGTKP